MPHKFDVHHKHIYPWTPSLCAVQNTWVRFTSQNIAKTQNVCFGRIFFLVKTKTHVFEDFFVVRNPKRVFWAIFFFGQNQNTCFWRFCCCAKHKTCVLDDLFLFCYSKHMFKTFYYNCPILIFDIWNIFLRPILIHMVCLKTHGRHIHILYISTLFCMLQIYLTRFKQRASFITMYSRDFGQI